MTGFSEQTVDINFRAELRVNQPEQPAARRSSYRVKRLRVLALHGVLPRFNRRVPNHQEIGHFDVKGSCQLSVVVVSCFSNFKSEISNLKFLHFPVGFSGASELRPATFSFSFPCNSVLHAAAGRLGFISAD